MLQVLVVTFPFFALVLCGYVAARLRALPEDTIGGLNTFVLYFALPCLLFRLGASTPVEQLLDPALFGVYLISAAIMVGVTMAVTLSHRINWNNAAFGALVAAFPNTGYMGVPLVVAFLGQKAAGPAIVTLVVDLLFTSSLCVALSRLDRADKHGATVAVRNALRGMAINPLPWSIALGTIASAAGLSLPGPVAKTVSLLADAASPTALFTIGAVLARSQMNSSDPTPLTDYVPVALKKLVLHPVLVLGMGVAAMKAGVPLDRSALTAVVLLAALPSASNVVLLAERFDADSGRIARVILVSTLLSFLTFSAAVTLLV